MTKKILLKNYSHLTPDVNGEVSDVCEFCSADRKKQNQKCLCINIKKLTYYCQHCGDSGKVIDDERLNNHQPARQRQQQANKINTIEIPKVEYDAFLEPATADEPYLKFKQIQDPQGFYVVTSDKTINASNGKTYQLMRGNLVVPAFNKSKDIIICMETIYQNGEGKFEKRSYGSKARAFAVFGNLSDATYIYVSEGAADAATINQCTGADRAAICIFGTPQADNALSIIKDKIKNKTITIAFDSDDAGLKAAEECSKKYRLSYTFPTKVGIKDFNELYIAHGEKAVTDQLNSVVTPPEPEPVDPVKTGKFPDPNTFNSQEMKEPRFPIEVLGDFGVLLQDVAKFHGVPIGVAFSCAQSAVHLLVQALANVRHFQGNIIPLSEYFLTVAISGDRKSTTESFFMVVIEEALAILWQSYNEEKEIYDSKMRDYENLKKNDKETTPKPKEPRMPTIYGIEDLTMEGACRNLDENFPFMLIGNDEAGTFLGGYAMSNDHRTKTISMLSSLFSGKNITTGIRGDRTRTPKRLVNRRVSVNLMMQPVIFKKEIKDSDLMKGQGILSRMLTIYPDSLAGGRFVEEIPENVDPAEREKLLDRWRAYMKPLTDKLKDRENGIIFNTKTGELENLKTLELSRDANHALRVFYNEIEAELASGGKYELIRSFGSRVAEHAHRIAGSFAIFLNNNYDTISKENTLQSIPISKYYLDENLRIAYDAAGQIKTDEERVLEKLLELNVENNLGGIVSIRDIARNFSNSNNPLSKHEYVEYLFNELVSRKYLFLLPDGTPRKGKSFSKAKTWMINPKALKNGLDISRPPALPLNNGEKKHAPALPALPALPAPNSDGENYLSAGGREFSKRENQHLENPENFNNGDDYMDGLLNSDIPYEPEYDASFFEGKPPIEQIERYILTECKKIKPSNTMPVSGKAPIHDEYLRNKDEMKFIYGTGIDVADYEKYINYRYLFDDEPAFCKAIAFCRIEKTVALREKELIGTGELKLTRPEHYAFELFGQKILEVLDLKDVNTSGVPVSFDYDVNIGGLDLSVNDCLFAYLNLVRKIGEK